MIRRRASATVISAAITKSRMSARLQQWSQGNCSELWPDKESGRVLRGARLIARGKRSYPAAGRVECAKRILRAAAVGKRGVSPPGTAPAGYRVRSSPHVASALKSCRWGGGKWTSPLEKSASTPETTKNRDGRVFPMTGELRALPAFRTTSDARITEADSRVHEGLKVACLAAGCPPLGPLCGRMRLSVEVPPFPSDMDRRLLRQHSHQQRKPTEFRRLIQWRLVPRLA
jgi:hypothetical protein